MLGFTDQVNLIKSFSRLKGKDIQERFNKLEVTKAFADNGPELLNRIKLYVYPYINGKDLPILLVMFHLVQQCCGDDAKVEVSDEEVKSLFLIIHEKAGICCRKGSLFFFLTKNKSDSFTLFIGISDGNAARHYPYLYPC